MNEKKKKKEGREVTVVVFMNYDSKLVLLSEVWI
jgi:hypothetical protein